MACFVLVLMISRRRLRRKKTGQKSNRKDSQHDDPHFSGKSRVIFEQAILLLTKPGFDRSRRSVVGPV
ncbi:MAG: hypothetical protein WD795_13095 [Woeseia sp.]